MLKTLFSKKEEIDGTVAKQFFTAIDTKILSLNANEPKIEGFLSTGSKNQLHSKSSHYFVTEDLWEVMKAEILEPEKQKALPKDDVLNLYKDYIKLEDFFSKKMLLFKAS